MFLFLTMDTRSFLVILLGGIIVYLASWEVSGEHDSITCGRHVCHNQGRCYNDTCICFDGWSGENCTQTTRCGRFPVEHAVILVDEAMPRYTGHYGEVITYTCTDGYQFEDAEAGTVLTPTEKEARCNENGQWQPADIACLAICPPIPTWRGYLADTTLRLAGTTIRYICYGRYAWYETNNDELEYKYRFVDGVQGDETERVTTCMSNATWWPPIDSCMQIVRKSDYSSSSSVTVLSSLNLLISMVVLASTFL